MERDIGILVLAELEEQLPKVIGSSSSQLKSASMLSVLLSPQVALQICVRLLATITGWFRYERLPVTTVVQRLFTTRVRMYTVSSSCSNIGSFDTAFALEGGLRLATRISPQERTWFVNSDSSWGPSHSSVLAVLLRPHTKLGWRTPATCEARVQPLWILSPDNQGGWSHESISLGHFMPTRAQTVRGIEIWHSRFIVQENKLLLSEGRSDPRQDFVSGVSTFFLRDGTPGSRPRTRLAEPPPQWDFQEKGIFACGRADTNWFHWIVDHLPQLLQADREIDPDVPYLVRSHLPTQMYESLGFLSHRRRLQVPDDRRLKVDLLHVPIFPGCVTDSPNIEMVSGVFDIEGVRILRQAFFNRESKQRTLGGRIFTARSSPHRILRNQEAVHEVLEEACLQRFHPAQSSFALQLSQYRNTDLLVAEGGADLAAMVMMRPGSHVVGLVSDAKGQANLWTELAEILEIKFTPIVGVHDPGDSSVHASFVLTREGLETLQEIVRG